MSIRRAGPIVATSFALLLAIFACTPDPQPTSAPTQSPTQTATQPSEEPTETPTPTDDPSPTPTQVESFPPPPADESEERASIREGWEEYQRVFYEFAADPTVDDWTETQYVTTGQESSNILTRLGWLREDNKRVEGDTVFRDVEITDPERNADGVAIAFVTACLDPSHRRIVDLDTGEPTEDQLTETLQERATMEEGADGIWRVALFENEFAEC